MANNYKALGFVLNTEINKIYNTAIIQLLRLLFFTALFLNTIRGGIGMGVAVNSIGLQTPTLGLIQNALEKRASIGEEQALGSSGSSMICSWGWRNCAGGKGWKMFWLKLMQGY